MGDIVITPASNDVNSTAGTLVVRASDLNPISLRTNNVNRLYIDPTGSVGINTTSPTSKLNVVETTATGTRIQLGTSQEGTIMSANATNDLLILNAPYGANAATTSNLGAKWGIKFVGAVDSALNNNNKTSAIYAVSEDPLGYNRGTSLAFYTNQFNDIPYSEKMRIYHNGNIGIGITNPTNKVHISGGGISFTTSTGLAVPMLGIVLPTNIAYIGPYTTSTDGNAPTVVAFNQGSSVQQTWFYASGRISMVLNRQGRLHIGDNNNAPNCLLSVGPTSSTAPASGMCFGNDAQANLYRSSEDIIKTDGGLIVTNNLLVGELATNPSTKIRVNGSFSQRASGNTAIQEYKNIVTFNLDGNGNGGYVIKTPFRLGSSYEMVILHVKGYGYGTAALYDFKIVFYDYAPSHQPVNYSLVDLGNDGSPKFLAKDADNYVQVCFGNTTDVNNYFYRFTVDCITTRNDNDYSQGWAMYQTSSANFGFASTGVYVVNSPVNFRTSNYVGIGTTNPVQKLQVEGVVGNPAFVGTTQSGIFRISNTSDNAALDFGLRPGGLGAWIQSTDESSLATNYPLLLNPNGANVGIGTTNPLNRLSVIGSNSTNYYNATAPVAVFQAASPSTVLVAVDGNVDGYYAELKLGNAQSTYYPYSAYIRGIQGAGIDYYRMEFGTSNGSAAATRMTIADDGNVGIGTTRQSGKLHVAGNIFLSADLIGNDGTRGYLLGKDSVSAGRVYLILDPNAANGIGVGSDYLYIAQENTTGVISNSAGPLLLNPGGGNVGIGTTNAVAQFHIGGTASNNNPWAVLDIADTYFKRIVFSEERVAYGITAYGGYIGYDANANTVSLGTYNNSSENRSINILRDNGNVGIGVTNPTYTLQVGGTFYVNSTSFFNGAMTVEDSLTVDGRLNGSDGVALLKMRAGNSAGSWNDVNLQYEKNSSADSLHFNMGDTTISNASVRLTVQNNGNIGIGTTRPGGLLHVFNTTGRYITYIPGSASGLLIQKNAIVSSQGAVLLTLANAQGPESFPDRGTALNLDIGYSGTPTIGGSIARGARIAALNHNIYDATAANQNAYLAFYTATGGTLTEKLRVHGDGKVGIGTASPYSLLDVQLASASQRYLTLSTNDGQGSFNGFGLNFRIANTDHDIAQIRGDYESSAAGGYGGLFFATRFSGVLSNRVAFNDNGRVGIGVSYASTLLSVGGPGSTVAASGITLGADSVANLYRISTSRIKTDGSLTIDGGGGNALALVLNRSSTSSENGISFNTAGSTDWYYYVDNATTNLQIQRSTEIDSAPRVRFNGANSDILFNLGGGNIGVGTSLPSGKLHVVSTISNDTVLRADGTNGTLFSVVDDLSDSLMSVNNSAGLPVLEVFANDRVVMGQYGSGDLVVVNNEVGIGTTNPINKLSVIGNASIGSTYNVAAPANGLIVQGNVGIGSTSPAYKLDCYSTNGVAEVARFYNNQTACNFSVGSTANTLYSNYVLYTSNGNAQFFKNRSSTDWGGADSLNIYTSNGAIAFHPANTANRVYFATDGNVGIGVSTPAQKLDVKGYVLSDLNSNAVAGGFFVGNASHGIRRDAGSNDVRLHTNGGDLIFGAAGSGSQQVTLKNGGNVGIGSINPSYKLEVYSAAKTSEFVGLSISNFNNYDGTAASLVTSQLRFAILETPTDTYNAPSRTFATCQAGNEANNSSSDGFFAISTRSSAVVAEKFRITSAGNVGIGTTNPGYRLNVTGGDINFASNSILRFGTVAVLNESSNANDIYANIRVIRNRSSTLNDGMYVNYDSLGTTAAHLRFYANGTNERMRIDASNGYVGVGTTVPDVKFDVYDNLNGGNISAIRNASSGSNAYSALVFRRDSNLNGLVMFTNSSLRSSDGGLGNSTIRTDNGKLLLGAGASTYHSLETNGNVGIGLTNPSAARLHIKGNTTDPVLRVETALLEAGTTTSSKTFVAWLPIMTGAAVGDKVFIPLFK